MKTRTEFDKEIDAVIVKQGAQKSFCYSTGEGKAVPFVHYYRKHT